MRRLFLLLLLLPTLVLAQYRNDEVNNIIIHGYLDAGTANTFTDSDTTPDVSGNMLFNTNTSAVTIIDFDAGSLSLADGHVIIVVSKGAITYDCTSSGLQCGTVDIVTASGDVTGWMYDGADWQLWFFKDQSTDMGTDAGTASGDNVSVDSVDIADPDFVSTGDIDFSNSGSTVTADINSDVITEAMLDLVSPDGLTDEYCLTYESDPGGSFEWQVCGGGGSGDVTDVGDCDGTGASGACFTGADGTTLSTNTDLIIELDKNADDASGADTFQIKDSGGTIRMEVNESGEVNAESFVVDISSTAQSIRLYEDGDSAGAEQWSLTANDNLVTTDTDSGGSYTVGTNTCVLHQSGRIPDACVGDGTDAGASGMSTWLFTGDSGSAETVNDGETVDVAGGDGITTAIAATNTVTVTADLVTAGSDADSSTTQSDSGLEFVGNQLTLLRGCADNQILIWDETDDDWNCENETGGSGEANTTADAGLGAVSLRGSSPKTGVALNIRTLDGSDFDVASDIVGINDATYLREAELASISDLNTQVSGTVCHITGAYGTDCPQPGAGDYGAQSIDGNDVSTGIAGRSLNMNTTPDPDVIDADVELYTESTSVFKIDWAITDEVVFRAFPVAATVTRIECEAYSGTSFTIKICKGEDIGDDTCTTNLLDATESTTLVCDTTGVSDTTINSGSLTARQKVTIVVTAQTGDPEGEVYIEATLDD